MGRMDGGDVALVLMFAIGMSVMVSVYTVSVLYLHEPCVCEEAPAK
jgi:hypothetical protein